jgi:muramoyltetrapeptide carboxypeptidase
MTAHIIKPPALSPGDVIGIVAPSLPLLPSWREHYEAGKGVLRSLGFQLLEGESIHREHWWSAGHPVEQAADINSMFANPEVRAIIGLTGGFSAMAVLDLLDYDLIRQHPKPFMGMSDITQYQWAMFVRCGLVGFHTNDVVFGFGEMYSRTSPEQQRILRDLYFHLLTSNDPPGSLPALSRWECWRAGTANGRLIGGSLKRFVALAGTAYFPSPDTFDGAILFFEEVGETIYDISLNLYKLKHLGVLEQLAGMVIGQLTWVNEYFPEVTHPTPREAILEIVQEYQFPILANVDFGHQISMLPMVIGLMAHMDSASLLLEISETAVVR